MTSLTMNKSRLGWLVLTGTLLLLGLIVAATALIFVVAWRLNAQENMSSLLAGTTPLNELNVENIDPALALASLGGVSPADVVTEAIDKARPETALATLLFEPALSNRATAGGFLQLAQTYANMQQLDKAGFSYKMAGTVATLAPDISDTVRADLLMQSGEGLLALEQQAPAKFYLDQAFAIASGSPYLQAAHRRRIFERLQKNYIILDERVQARESLSLSANPPQLALVVERRSFLDQGSVVPLPETVQQAEATRWQAAQELAILLVERGGNAPAEMVTRLAQTLQAEDEAKLTYFEQELANATQLSRTIDLTMAKIAWLSTKYRVARQGYGLSIVPEWEAQVEEIRAELTKSYESLYALYADLIVALPNIAEIDQATVERLRNEVLAGELGRYPNYPEEQRRSQLLDGMATLIETQPEINIFVSVETLENERYYTLTTLQ